MASLYLEIDTFLYCWYICIVVIIELQQKVVYRRK